MIGSFLLSPRASHGLVWLVAATLSFSSFWMVLGWQNALLKTTVNVGTLMGVAYGNMHGLLPSLFEKKRHTLYGLAVMAVAIVVTVLFIAIDRRFPFQGLAIVQIRPGFPAYNFVITVSTLVMSTMYQLNKGVQRYQAVQQQLINQQLNTELDLLRTQINPHFLFNTLNNLYTLAYLKSERTAPMISQLAELMRYLLYQGRQPWVPLEKEVAFLRSYLDLYQLKHENPQVSFRVDIDRPHHPVEPMLFIPLIENCFKYCDLDAPGGFIDLHLQLAGPQLSLLARNSCAPTPPQRQPGVGGVGLSNLGQRLALRYPGRHQLQNRLENGVFTASLVILLDQNENS
ncbi:MAG: sensor histidine kinase [Bernardetiaceae bacterium]|jgi:sensor histidine kinase YesM|nr:sensor histidine kinase [Bernardetiaceae bacterium]